MRPVIMVGVDPGATTGAVALLVDADAPALRTSWRWLDSTTVSKASRSGLTDAENALMLYVRLLDWFTALMERSSVRPARIHTVAIERPAEMETTGFRATGQGADKRPQAAGTSFGIGESCGFAQVAAHAVDARVHTYAAISRKASAKHPKERVGWMPMVRGGARGHLVHVIKREHLLYKLHHRSVELRTQTASIVSADTTAMLSDHERMALGVLLFHLSRQIGAQ